MLSFACRNLTSSDPSWVGAWWLGYIISTVIATILALFMFLFPRELPGMYVMLTYQLNFN